MKTIVIVNAVPLEGVKVTAGKLDFGEGSRLAPASRAALVLALSFSDDVIALSIAGDEDAMYEALAYGAKRAVRIASDARATDAAANANLLAAALDQMGDATLLFGEDELAPGTLDPTGAYLAGLKQWQYISGVEKVEGTHAGYAVLAQQGDTQLRYSSDGLDYMILGVRNAAIAAHTLPWAGGIINAYRDGKVETLTVAADAGKLTLNQLAPPTKREGRELLTDPAAEATAALLEMLRSRAII